MARQSRTEDVPPGFTLLTQVMGLQGRSYNIDKLCKVLRHYNREPRPGSKTEIAWQLKQLEMELGITRHDRLSILAGTAPPYNPPQQARERRDPTERGHIVRENFDFLNGYGFRQRIQDTFPPAPYPPPQTHHQQQAEAHLQQRIQEPFLRVPTPPAVCQERQAEAPLQQPFRSRLQPTEMCQVCLTEFHQRHFPSYHLTIACNHEPRVCLECLGEYLQHSVSNTRWNLIKCPLCPSLLSFADVQKHASAEVFERYDRLATLATLSDLPDFRFCLNPACNSGQLHTPNQGEELSNLMTCEDCGSRSCFTHQVPWHEGKTCAEFDAEIRAQEQRRGEDEATARYLETWTKLCPNRRCAVRIVKRDRKCDHITCKYLCLFPPVIKIKLIIKGANTIRHNLSTRILLAMFGPLWCEHGP